MLTAAAKGSDIRVVDTMQGVEATDSTTEVLERNITVSVEPSFRIVANMEGNATVRDGQTEGGYEASGTIHKASALEFIAAYAFAGGDIQSQPFREAIALLVNEHGL